MLMIVLMLSIICASISTVLTVVKQFTSFYEESPKLSLVLIVLMLVIPLVFYLLVKKNVLKTKKDEIDIDKLSSKEEEKESEEIGEKEEENIYKIDDKLQIVSGDRNKSNEILNIQNFEIDDLNLDLCKGSLVDNHKNNMITYDYLKQIYNTDEFLKIFYEASLINLSLKKEQYFKLYNSTKNEYLSTKKNVPFSLVPNPRYQESVDILSSTLKEIKDILIQIYSNESLLKKKGLSLVKKNLDLVFYSENGLESLIGRTEVKDFIALRLYTFAKNPRVFFSTFQNILLYGPPGFGKSKIGKTIGWVYSTCGIFVKQKFQIITKSSVATGYVNESGPKTKNLLLSNLEGVIFFDEAYEITPPNVLGLKNVDHGSEVMTELVNFIDKMMGLNVIIAAGYEAPMKERFLGANPGLPRRFPNEITLQAYNPTELTKILMSYLINNNPQITFGVNEANFIYTLIKNLEEKSKKQLNIDTLFPSQGGDMNILSADIANCYYGNINNATLNESILNGFNTFIGKRNYHIRLNSDNFPKYERYTTKDSNDLHFQDSNDLHFQDSYNNLVNNDYYQIQYSSDEV